MSQSRKRELEKNLLDISASVKDAAAGLLEDSSPEAVNEGKVY